MKKTEKTFDFSFLVIALTVLLLVGCGSQEQEATEELPTLEDKNKELVQANTEKFWNAHDMDVFDEHFSPDFVAHFADGDKTIEEYKGLCQAYMVAFPDLHITTHDLVAEGDKVTKVWTANSTHQGELMGIPATGNKIVVKGIYVYRISEGKIAELWVSMDNLGMMQQLGVIPPMEE
jgi:steroid delta-isomerase-like uncharacterized protein